MSDLSLLAPQSSYFALLNTQSTNGFDNLLQPIQDGLGRNSPLSLSLTGIDINTTMGSGFTIDNIQLIATATQINNVCHNASFSAFTSALALPSGSTLQRPATPSNGQIRYNSTTQSGELYAAGTWMTINAGNPSGYYPGGPTYIQDTYLAGTFNLSVGSSPQDLTFRTQCTFFGDSVAPSASSGSNLCAFGYQSLMSISSGSDNSSFGHQSGKSTVAGIGNSYFGKSAGESNVSSDRNSFFGALSGRLTTGDDNSFFGASSAAINVNGFENCVFGSLACENSDGISECCAFGFSAMQENEQNRISAYGALALTSNISGEALDAFGYASQKSNVYGNGNSSFAQNSLFSNIDGDYNCAFGFESIYSNTAGNGNSGIGYTSLWNATGDFNSGFGYKSGLALTSGTLNTFVGAHAGETGDLVGLTGCTLIGAQSQCAAGLINATAIGFQATVNTDDSLVLGKTGTNVGIGNSSPEFPLDVFGSAYFQGITSGYTGTGILKEQYGVRTNGVTPAYIDFGLHLDEPNILNITVKISVINTAGTKSAYSNSTAVVFYNGVVTASTGTLPTITMTSTAGYAPTAAWSISGNDLRLTVTGVAASSEIWVISYEMFTTYSVDT